MQQQAVKMGYGKFVPGKDEPKFEWIMPEGFSKADLEISEGQ